MIKVDKDYRIFNIVTQIFGLDEETRRHKTDKYTRLQLRVCEENSIFVDTEMYGEDFYLHYKFTDDSSAILKIAIPSEVALNNLYNEAKQSSAK